MEEIFENSFLDELFKARKTKFETHFLQKYGKEFKKEMEDKENQFKNLIYEAVKDRNLQKKLVEQYEKISKEQQEYWNNAYYKIGIVDGIKFVREVKKMYEL